MTFFSFCFSGVLVMNGVYGGYTGILLDKLMVITLCRAHLIRLVEIRIDLLSAGISGIFSDSVN